MSYRDQINKKCNVCGNEDPRNCTGKDCPLFKVRIFKKNEETESLREAIKAKCLDCMGESLRLVVTCRDDYCPFYHCRRDVIGREVFDNEEELGEIFGG